MDASKNLDIRWSGLSHVGPVREDNQDAIRMPEEETPGDHGFLYAVADGMGGYAHGERASALTLDALAREFYGRGAIPKNLRRGVELANLNVYQEAQRLGAGRMGSTLTAAGIQGNQLYLAHVGDSRAYLVRNKCARCLTCDHTTVGELVRMRVISPEKVRTHAHRSILTKGVGLSLFVRPDLEHYTLQEDDTLILCSDGVWSVIEDDEFAQIAAATPDVETLSRRFVETALERETDDNASVVTVHVRGLGVANARPKFFTDLIQTLKRGGPSG